VFLQCSDTVGWMIGGHRVCKEPVPLIPGDSFLEQVNQENQYQLTQVDWESGRQNRDD